MDSHHPGHLQFWDLLKHQWLQSYGLGWIPEDFLVEVTQAGTSQMSSVRAGKEGVEGGLKATAHAGLGPEGTPQRVHLERGSQTE